MTSQINNKIEFVPPKFTNSLTTYILDEVITPTDPTPTSDPTPTDDKRTTPNLPTEGSPVNPEAHLPESPKPLKTRKTVQLPSQPQTPVEKIVSSILQESPETLENYPKTDNNQKLGQAVQTAFEKLTKFQREKADLHKTRNSPFPASIETQEFGIIVASPEKGYIITTSDPIKSGRFNEFYKLIEVKGNSTIRTKAGRLCSEVAFETFKQLNLKIVESNMPNVMPLEFVWEAENFLFQVNPLYSGDIYTISKQENWDFDKTLMVMIEAINGIAMFHSENYVHRDLTPTNIYVKGDEVVIGDLDTSIKMGDKLPKNVEVSSGGIYADKTHTPSSRTDMFSFGGCLITLFERLIPDLNSIVTSNAVYSRRYKGLTPKERALVKLIQELRSNMPAARPNALATMEALKKISQKK